ncbi:peptidoglycan-binding domain 1, partial [Clostridium sporogenes PA 3679]
MAKFGIDCGHTMSGADYGAVGIKAESNLTREVGT